jgi:hypothetical protein
MIGMWSGRRGSPTPATSVHPVLGIPVGTVKSRLNRSMSALRAAIDADERLPGRLLEMTP